MTFDELNLVPALLDAVREQGYTQPTPVQAQAIPLVLAGHDLLAGAQTGTGKTAAFTLPLLQRLHGGPKGAEGQAAQAPHDAPKRGQQRPIRALVLTPTRELAAQVEESVRVYGKHLHLKSTVIFGGVGMNPQIDKLARGVDVLVATPGRLLDLVDQGRLDLSKVEILVLDEADRMLDMGFIHDVKKILRLLPAAKQSLLFSATFSDEIRELANGLLRNPQHIQVTPPNTTVQRIVQTIHPVGRGKKKALLAHIIKEHDWSQVLVFTRTKFGANNVADYLNAHGIGAMALHGNKSQSARTQALADFKSGSIRALVATDIAARGIDIDDLPHVVNYDIPNVCEDYVHRIGRTGRAGAEGAAVSLVSLDEEGFMMAIEKFTKQQIAVQAFPEFMPEADEKAEPIAMGRQTLWGGAGKPPGREVMAAAGRAARKEMTDRVRDSKGGGRNAKPAHPRAGAHPARPAPQRAAAAPVVRDDDYDDDAPPPRHADPLAPARPANAAGRRRNPRPNGGGGFGPSGPRSQAPGSGPRQGAGQGPARSRGAGSAGAAGPGGPARQPDPLRTGIDALGQRGGGGGNRSRSGGGGGGGGGGQGGIDPLRTRFGRIK